MKNGNRFINKIFFAPDNLEAKAVGVSMDEKIQKYSSAIKTTFAAAKDATKLEGNAIQSEDSGLSDAFMTFAGLLDELSLHLIDSLQRINQDFSNYVSATVANELEVQEDVNVVKDELNSLMDKINAL